MAAYDDPNDYSSLFVAFNIVKSERGIIHKLDYHQPWQSPQDKGFQKAGWKIHNGIYYDPTRWTVAEIEEARTKALEIMAIDESLREAKAILYKFRDRHKKGPIPPVVW